jgi:hypothetical protein
VVPTFVEFLLSEMLYLHILCKYFSQCQHYNDKEADRETERGVCPGHRGDLKWNPIFLCLVLCPRTQHRTLLNTPNI